MTRTAWVLAALAQPVLLDVAEGSVQGAAGARRARPPRAADGADAASGVDADVREGEEDVPLLAAALQPGSRLLSQGLINMRTRALAGMSTLVNTSQPSGGIAGHTAKPGSACAQGNVSVLFDRNTSVMNSSMGFTACAFPCASRCTCKPFKRVSVRAQGWSGRTVDMGACDSPALTPVTPHVSTPPRPLVLNDIPTSRSSFDFRVLVTSSRHRLHIAAVNRAQRGGSECFRAGLLCDVLASACINAELMRIVRADEPHEARQFAQFVLVQPGRNEHVEFCFNACRLQGAILRKRTNGVVPREAVCEQRDLQARDEVINAEACREVHRHLHCSGRRHLRCPGHGILAQVLTRVFSMAMANKLMWLRPNIILARPYAKFYRLMAKLPMQTMTLSHPSSASHALW